MGRRKKLAKKVTQVERELGSLSNDIQKAIEEEERVLARLKTDPCQVAWRTLRHNCNYQPCLGYQSGNKEVEEESKSIGDGEVGVRDTHGSEVKTTESMYTPSPKRRLEFGDYSSMDSDSKFERIRQDIHLQEDKIRFLMSRMKEHKQTDPDQCTSQSI